jgi:hypothetical protein
MFKSVQINADRSLSNTVATWHPDVMAAHCKLAIIQLVLIQGKQVKEASDSFQ